MSYIILACLCWAIDPLFRNPLINTYHLKELHIVIIGETFLTLLFILRSLWQKQKIFPPQLTFKDTVFFLFLAGCSGFGIYSYTKAIGIIGPGKTIIIQKLQVFITIFLGIFFLQEKLTSKFLGALLICLLGAVILSYEDIYLTTSPSLAKGYIYALGAILCWGTAPLIGKKLLVKYTESQVLFLRFFLSLCLYLPFLFASPFSNQSLITHFPTIFFISFISGFVGMSLYYKGLNYTPLKKVALAEISFPVFGVILSWIFLGLSLSSYQILGGIMILAGCLFVEFSKNA